MAKEREMESVSGRRLGLLFHHLCPPSPPRFPLPLVNACSQTSSLGAPVVIGAMVLDIHASPFSDKLTSGTTTPGRVQFNRGGVARNVSECMSRLGIVPFLISVVGEDMAGDILLQHWRSLGLVTDGIRQCTGLSTPVVAAIFDMNGELKQAVADTHIVEQHLTAEWIAQFETVIKSAAFLMLDANLNPTALETACKCMRSGLWRVYHSLVWNLDAVAKAAHVPIWFEPVSVSKSARYTTISKYIDYVSPNETELVTMGNVDTKHEKIPSNVPNSDDSEITIHALIQHLQPHILVLLQKGVTYVVVTVGRLGVLLCSKACNLNKSCNWNQRRLCFDDVDISIKKPTQIDLDHNSRFTGQDLQHWECTGDNVLSSRKADASVQFRSIEICYVHFPALPASIVSLSGAGDCFVAGALVALCQDKDISSSMACGVAVARQAIQSELNVPPYFSYSDLRADAKLVLDSARQTSQIVCPVQDHEG